MVSDDLTQNIKKQNKEHKVVRVFPTDMVQPAVCGLGWPCFLGGLELSRHSRGSRGAHSRKKKTSESECLKIKTRFTLIFHTVPYIFLLFILMVKFQPGQDHHDSGGLSGGQAKRSPLWMSQPGWGQKVAWRQMFMSKMFEDVYHFYDFRLTGSIPIIFKGSKWFIKEKQCLDFWELQLLLLSFLRLFMC